MSTKREISQDQLAVVGSLVADASSSGGLAEAFRIFTEGLVGLVGADRVLVHLEQDGRLIACYADEGSVDRLGTEAPVEGSVAGACYRAGGPVMSEDLARDRRFDDLELDPAECSLIAVPLHLEGPPIGVIRVTSMEPGRFRGADLTLTRLVVAAMRKTLLAALRAERESLGIKERRFATEGVWALRDRRKIHLRRAAAEGNLVSLVRYELRGYLTADIVHHISGVVRSSDHVFQDDAGAFTMILTGAGAADAEIVARRVTCELEKLAELAGDRLEVSWQVTELQHDPAALRIA